MMLALLLLVSLATCAQVGAGTKRIIRANPLRTKILRLTQQFLDASSKVDYEAFKALVDENISMYDLAVDTRVQGSDYFKFWFDHETDTNVTILLEDTKFRALGANAAFVAFTLMEQYMNSAGKPAVVESKATCIWEKQPMKGWRLVHWHRSSFL